MAVLHHRRRRCAAWQVGRDFIQLAVDLVRELVDQGMLSTPLVSSGDWLDTLQVVETMDLVLTVDTAMAHLCGAVGVPCVVLLNAPCDWRWGQSGERTFLYDSIRLARCPAPHTWDQAMVSADRWIAEWMS